MHPAVRKAFPFVVGVMTLATIIWAVSFGTLPKADFTFANGDAVKTIDPPKATGAPEGRIINALFEGLYRNHPRGMVIDENGKVVTWPEPDADGNVPMEPVPAMAKSCDISKDGKTYTFTMREGALWSDESPVTARDFSWSPVRILRLSPSMSLSAPADSMTNTENPASRTCLNTCCLREPKPLEQRITPKKRRFSPELTRRPFS